MVIRQFYKSVSVLVLLNLLLKPIWIFLIDRKVQLLVGNEAYGDYFSLLNIAIMGSVVLDGGLQIYFTLQINQLNKTLLNQLGFLKLILAVVYFAITIIASLLITGGINSMLLLLVIAQIINAFILLGRSFFSSSLKFSLDSFFSIADKLLATILIGILLYITPKNITTSQFVVVQIVCSVILLIVIIIWLYKLKVFNLDALYSFNPLVKKIAPYALLIFTMALLLRMDVVLLKLLSKNGADEAGKYAYGYRIFDALNSFGFLIASFLFPFLCKNIKDKKLVQKTTKQLTFSILLIAFFGLVAYLSFTNFITNILYHTIAKKDVIVIGFCIAAFIGNCLVHIYSSVLTAANQIRQLTIITAIFIVLNLTINTIFIPKYGASCCAVTLFFTQLFYGAFLFLICKKKALL